MKKILYNLGLLIIFAQNTIYCMEKETKIPEQSTEYETFLKDVEQLYAAPNKNILRKLVQQLHELKNPAEAEPAISLIQGALHQYTETSNEFLDADEELSKYYRSKTKEEETKILKLEREIKHITKQENINFGESENLGIKEEKERLQKNTQNLIQELERITEEHSKLQSIFLSKEHDLEIINEKKFEENPDLKNKMLTAQKNKLLEEISALENLKKKAVVQAFPRRK